MLWFESREWAEMPKRGPKIALDCDPRSSILYPRSSTSSLFLHFILRIDDVVLLAVAGGFGAVGAGTGRRRRAGAGLALAVQVLGHGVGDLFQLGHRGADRGYVVALRGRLDLLDGRLDRRLVTVGNLGGVLLHQLLELIAHL